MAAPGSYYTGPPAVPHDKHEAPPSEPEPVPKPVDGQQVNAPVVPGGYYNGPALKADDAAGGQGSSAAPKESGFFANCCACFSGGQTAR